MILLQLTVFMAAAKEVPLQEVYAQKLGSID